MRFDDCLAIILKFEGGYSNDFFDRGGATNLGITQLAYDAYRMAVHLPLQPVLSIGTDEGKGIYKRQYWDAVRASTMPTPIDLVLFDAAVQHGPMRAVKFLQRALGIGADGIIGRLTAKALNEEAVAQSLGDVWRNMLEQRIEFYHELSTKPGQVRFLKGWMNRMDGLRKECER